MMHHKDKNTGDKPQLVPVAQRQGTTQPAAQFIDNRPRSVVERKQLEALAEGRPVQRAHNNTGLPDQLKSGIENLSGHSMDDVKVHYNSAKPAQLNAHA